MKNLNGIALGTFPFANVFSNVDEETASKILKTFIENGGEFIHVSVAYNSGKVEEFLGKELKKYDRNQFKIMACCGWTLRDGKYVLSGKAEHVKKCCDEVLKRLNLEYVDVLMSHAPDISTPYEETIDAMNELLEEGKCKELCVSNVSLEQLKRYNYRGTVKYIQNRFSLINQSISEEMYNYCKINDIKITTYQSIERGLLTDRVIEGLKLNENDLRLKKPEFRDEIQEEIGLWAFKWLKPIANELNVSILTLVIAWTLKNQNIFAVICGISKEKYYIDYLNVNKINITNEILGKINFAYNVLQEEIYNKYQKTIIEFLGI